MLRGVGFFAGGKGLMVNAKRALGDGRMGDYCDMGVIKSEGITKTRVFRFRFSFAF